MGVISALGFPTNLIHMSMECKRHFELIISLTKYIMYKKMIYIFININNRTYIKLINL